MQFPPENCHIYHVQKAAVFPILIFMTSTMLRGNLVTEMSLVNDKLPHKAYYQGLLKRVTTTLRLISIPSDERFLHTSKESTVTSRLHTDHMNRLKLVGFRKVYAIPFDFMTV